MCLRLRRGRICNYLQALRLLPSSSKVRGWSAAHVARRVSIFKSACDQVENISGMGYEEWIDYFQSSPGAIPYLVQKYVAGQTTAGGGWERTTFNRSFFARTTFKKSPDQPMTRHTKKPNRYLSRLATQPRSRKTPKTQPKPKPRPLASSPQQSLSHKTKSKKTQQNRYPRCPNAANVSTAHPSQKSKRQNSKMLNL